MRSGPSSNSAWQNSDAVRRHLLVTNDFPPKIGGIQNYLWELWRRLDPDSVVVHCTPHAGAVSFDAHQPFRIERSPEPVLLPHPLLPERIRQLADDASAELVLLDPAIPLGLVGPRLGRPYGVVLHGAEVTIPGRLPGSKQALRHVLNGASLVISAGRYALDEAERCAGRSLPAAVIPPGVDVERFRPADPHERSAIRARFDLDERHLIVSCVTRLVPRKGMHTLVSAVSQLRRTHPELVLLIGGDGRQRGELSRLISETGAPARLLGRLSDDDLVELYQASDLMAMPCNSRWGGLEQEGFGIVFLEAAACGIPQIAGRSGGASEAVKHGVSGLIVDDPDEVDEVANALGELLGDAPRRARMGAAARDRMVEDFAYDVLARQLGEAIDQAELKLSGQTRNG